MSFLQKLQKSIQKNNSLLCIGLDADKEKLPRSILSESDPLFEFNKTIIDKTADLVSCYKANIAFYSAQGANGIEALRKTVSYIHAHYSDIPFILDAKRADIGNTAKQYAKEAFDVIKADAVTVNPYLGFDALEPFLERTDKGIIILCRTSNPGASDFQSLESDDEPLYLKVAQKVAVWNQKYNNCLLVVGATWPEELQKIRSIVPDMFFLVPGIGSQGGDLEKTLQYGLTKEKSGLIIHVARTIIYASEESFAESARKKALEIKNAINAFRS